MKILQISPYFNNNSASGSTKVAFDISHELVKRGHIVVVYASDKGKGGAEKEFEANDGLSVYHFPTIGSKFTRKLKLFITPYFMYKLRREIRTFDVIHLHEYYTFQNIMVHYYGKKYHIPYVLQAHGSLPRNTKILRKWFFTMLFGYPLLKDALKVIALSQSEAKMYLSMGVSQKKIDIISNGINLAAYSDLPPKGYFKKKFGLNDQVIVLYLGRMHKSKGLDLLAYSFKAVLRDFENVKLVMAGPDDGYLNTFRKLIESIGISQNVLFTGYLTSEDKMAAFVDARVFVTPCFSGFPIAFLEALVAGCPIITTNNELTWIDNNVGYVAERNPYSISEAILKIIKDENLYKKLRDNSLKRINELLLSAMIPKLEFTYNSAIEENKTNFSDLL
jgi:glycosyltransferase involved in cell wall biosynthesis